MTIANFGKVGFSSTLTSAKPRHGVLERAIGIDGSVWLYGKAGSSAISAGDCAINTSTGAIGSGDTHTAAVAIPANHYAWVKSDTGIG
jgi:hypothetical protein